MLILLDFYCPGCGGTYEDLVESKDRKSTCPECHAEAQQRLTAKTGFLSNPASPEVAAALRKRSHTHSVREARRNPEKLASSFGATPRVQQQWNLRDRKKFSSD